MRVRVSTDALDDVEASYDFYERQEKGVGTYFRQCIEQDLRELARTAGIHRKISGYHRVNSKVFQSILYYRMEQDGAVVVAILDGRIHPQTRDRVLTQRH